MLLRTRGKGGCADSRQVALGLLTAEPVSFPPTMLPSPREASMTRIFWYTDVLRNQLAQSKDNRCSQNPTAFLLYELGFEEPQG